MASSLLSISLLFGTIVISKPFSLNIPMNHLPSVSKHLLRGRTQQFVTTLKLSSTSMHQEVIPRAAVSVVVMYPEDNENKYVLVQRGKEPNKGMWSLPGGKIESGEESLVAAKRELWEETGLCSSMNDQHNFNLLWCEDGPVCTTDSIHKTEKTDTSGRKSENVVNFHYVISQWFVEAKPNGKGEITIPNLEAADDAADAKWWDLKSIQTGIDNGEVTLGVDKVILRTEFMYEKGILLTKET